MDLLDNAGESVEQSPEEILASLRDGSESKEAAPTTETPLAEKPVSEMTPQEYEYVIEGGKKVKEPLEMILKRAGLGYHYAQRAQLLNSQEEKYKSLEEANKKLSRWQEYNEFAEKNPDWWKHVETSWQSRNAQPAGEQVDNPLLPKISELEKQLQELSAFKEQFVQKQQSLEHETQDKEFRGEVEGVAKQFNVDLDQSDEQGRTLTWRVLEHMKHLGLDGSKKGHFTAAFKDFYFDNLQSRTAEKTKEQHAKSQEQMRKAGILGVSRTPNGAQSPLNGKIPGMSWDDLSKAALADKEIFGGR